MDKQAVRHTFSQYN
uniref:Uncharacterized protein n=1 Tax=Anguilla anguilla TaxID=7936 RepID=A0A0E9RVS4_ANGAN